MNVVVLMLFVSLVLALGSVLLFGAAYKNRDLVQMEQRSLMPLEEDEHGTENHNL